MGQYTELIFGASLKKDTPKEVIDVLDYLVTLNNKPKTLPEHDFFKNDRWEGVLCMGSYYFGVSDSVSQLWFDKIDKQWHLSNRSNLKNYDSEIENFLDWIKPYIGTGSGTDDFYAIVCNEEERTPTIYYKKVKEVDANGI